MVNGKRDVSESSLPSAVFQESVPWDHGNIDPIMVMFVVVVNVQFFPACHILVSYRGRMVSYHGVFWWFLLCNVVIPP